jgi:hypothetical protein
MQAAANPTNAASPKATIILIFELFLVTTDGWTCRTADETNVVS